MLFRRYDVGMVARVCLCTALLPSVFLFSVACADLTAPSGEDPNNLSQVKNTPRSAQSTAPIALQPGPAVVKESFMVRRILISYAGAENAKPEVKRTEAEARTLASKLSNQLQGTGGNFSELAKAHSDAPDAEHGGVLPAFTRDANLDPAIKTATFNTPVGKISDIITTPQGFMILQRLK
jgi:hypothetical protein